MVVWRFTRHLALDGQGGLFASARWHTRGGEILYCAPNPATALLEVLVNSGVSNATAFGDFYFLKLDVPEHIHVERVEEGVLPPDWFRRLELTRAWGDRWLHDARSAGLLVRSVLVPETYNLLINPRHADAAAITALATFPYSLDPRLFGPATVSSS